ncbi:hypothetical protein LTR01_006352 [Friedmanniomyces endolithicus]|nr:hypothetical protein LTR01_006352 [Friedmanniomyces endolithicus]KAK0824251.1 hypothetical protein LTR73_007933 [Friedmanniomyces endolithicus]
MPRAQVYGKRSRAICSNFAIFDSPTQRPTTLKPTLAEDVETRRLVEKVTGLSLEEYAKGVEDGRRRSVLGELNANSLVGPVVVEKKVKRVRAKRLTEAEREEEVDVELKTEAVVEETKEHVNRGLLVCDDVGERDVVVAGEAEEVPPATRQHSVAEDQTPALEFAASFTAAPDIDGEQQEQDRICAELMRVEHEPEAVAPAEPAHSPGLDTPTGPDVYSQHCNELLQSSSHRLTPFSDWADLLSNHFSLTKIAEASFGEVYRLSLLEQLPGLSASDESVFKVIALQQPPTTLPTAKKARVAALRKAEAMSKPDDVANEVKLLQRMSSTPGFTNFRDVRVLQGRPPPLFVDAFKRYNIEQAARQKECSHFPDPGKKTSYSDKQLWAVIEMQDAGTDLERLVEMKECTSIWSVWDVFWQVVLSLAKGEEGAEFEHRDLHLGNICVRHRGPSSSLLPHATTRGTTSRRLAATPTIDIKKNLGFTDLETTIIDYTISRCLLSSSNITSKSAGEIAYHDLALDSYLFQGDSTEEYQYDIYRYMRGAIYFSDPLATAFPDNTNTCSRTTASPKGPDASRWRKYHPITNLIWLHYLLHTLLEQVQWPSSLKPPAKRARSGAAHAEWKRASDLEQKLLRTRLLLDPLDRTAGLFCDNGIALRSASGLVGLAVGEGWLSVEDVVSAGGGDGSMCSGEVDGIEVEGGVSKEEEVKGVRLNAAYGGSFDSDDLLVDQMTHLVINVDVMEEHGPDAAEEEARSRGRRVGGRRKG